ncbi:MAG: alkaline phosphatase D family protein [Nitrososphaeraceae archaeon]
MTIIVSGGQVSAALTKSPFAFPLPIRSPDFQNIKFTDGVASGDVSQNSVVLWTRVNQQGRLTLDVSTFPDFKIPDFKKSNIPALKENDFTAKVTVTGLKPNQQYFYRWSAGRIVSELGTFKTAPTTAVATNIRFSWSGDTDVSTIDGKRVFGNWRSLLSALFERPDFFVYLGDVIYSDSRAGGDPRVPAAQTLDEFRQIYKDSRDIFALRTLLQRVPTYPLWDDHEVRSDWAGQTVDRFFYNIGNKAFQEYMPIGKVQTANTEAQCAGPPQYRVFHWGKAADVIIIDTRSCRSDNAQNICKGDIAPTLPPGCINAVNDPTRTMLGNTQKAMFKDALAHSTAKYKFVISSVSMQQAYIFPYDRWEGYSAERNEILNFIRDNHIQNVIFLTTDEHLNMMNDVFIDRFTNPTPIAYEFITGPIAALTDENNILKIFPVQGPQAVKAKQDILNLVVGVDCSNLNAFSYGSVDINSKTGVANVTLKDESGRTIRDETNQNIACTKTFGTESSTSSSPTSTTQNLDTPKSTTNSIEGLLQQQQKNRTEGMFLQQEEARQMDRNFPG